MQLITASQRLLCSLSMMAFAITTACSAEELLSEQTERPVRIESRMIRSGFPAGGVPGAPAPGWDGRRMPGGGPGALAVTSDATLPNEALQVLTQFRSHEAEQRAKLEAELQPARQRAIATLEALQDRFTREGQLDEAVAVRTQVRLLKAQQPGVLQDSGNLYAYRGRIGVVLLVNVTGSIEGSVYGSGTYTDDSDLSTAAVHAGVLKVGETDIVKVTILPGQDAYEASTSHGVTSYQYNTWGGSYRVESAKLPKVTPRAVFVPHTKTPHTAEAVPITDSISGVGSVGERRRLRVKGSHDGYVWGSGTYTDDSSIGTAAVHAGLLKVGEVGFVTVLIDKGRESYTGSTVNGVSSRDYHSWSRSFAFVMEETSPTPVVKPTTETTRIARDPGTLLEYRSKIGESFLFEVTGSTSGFVYGSDIYTDDSTLATVVVHAGIVKPGERTVVKVTMLPGRDGYTATIRNGIESRSWGTWSASFSVKNFGYPTTPK